MKRCFIYAHYDSNNEVKDYVIKQINLLHTLGDVLFISDSVSIKNVEDLSVCKYIQIGKHDLYDVYSYFSGYNFLKDTKTRDDYDLIYFVNDTILFPTCSEKQFIDKIAELENDPCNAWGMCKARYHLQSYWIGFKQSCYDFLDNFVKNYVHCTLDVLNNWWKTAEKSKWIMDRYIPRSQYVDSIMAKKWIYTVVWFETRLGKAMTKYGLTFKGADDGSWICSHYIIKRKDETLGPLVSVVVTLYNIKIEYVKEMINSLLSQSYKNIEILCMDDCSPVDYSELIKMSCKIKLIKNEKNMGMHKSVNKAFKLAKGKYIVRLGSDDIFDKDLIKKEVEYLEKYPNMDAVCCQLKCFGNSDRRISRPNKWDLEKILNGNHSGTGYAGGMMFKQSLLKYISIDESFKMCEDFDFHLQILEHGHIGSIHEDLYFYRSHSESLCNSIKRTERIQIFERVLEKHRKIYQSSIKDKV